MQKLPAPGWIGDTTLRTSAECSCAGSELAAVIGSCDTQLLKLETDVRHSRSSGNEHASTCGTASCLSQ